MPEAASIVINLPSYPFQNLSSAATIAALRATPSTGLLSGQDIIVDSGAAAGDGLGGVFAWSPASLVADNGASVIKPDDKTNLQAGRWLVISDNSQFANPASGGVPRATNAKLADLVSTPDFSTLAAAETAAAGRSLVFPSGAPLNITAPYTLTSPITDTLAQIFTSASAAFLTIDNGQPVRPEWFGAGNNGTVGVVSRACRACAVGGTVLLRDKRYQSGYDAALSNGTSVANVDYLAKAITVRGVKTPVPNGANSTLVNGSIIEGPFFVHASGVTLDRFGVDVGVTVTGALYGGADKDGLALYQPNQSSPTFATNVVIGDVVALGHTESTATHGVLLEGCDGLTIGRAKSYLFGLGVVVKSRNVNAGELSNEGGGGGGSGFAIYFKSDTYAPMFNVTVDRVVAARSASVAGTGLIVQAATANSASVKIGSASVSGFGTGITLQSESAILQGARIGAAYVDGCTNAVRHYGAQFSGIDDLNILNATDGLAVFEDVILPTSSYGSVTLTNVSGKGFVIRGITNVGSVYAANVGTLFSFDHANGRLNLAGESVRNTVTTIWAFASGAMTLAGAWTGATYFSEPRGGMVTLHGTISGGANGNIITAVPPYLRPAADTYCTALGYNGTTYAPVEIVVSAAGVVSATNYTAASTRLMLEGVAWKPA